MATELKSPSARFLFWMAHAIYNHRRWFFYPQLVLVLVSILFTVKKLDFLTSRNDLVGGEKEYHKIYLQFKDEFPVQADIRALACGPLPLAAPPTASASIAAAIAYRAEHATPASSARPSP